MSYKELLTHRVVADVGGFFGNPDPEMLTRWYHVGIFSPFFRAHAHIDTKRREPYLLDEPYKTIVKDAIRLRYNLLPVWYTAFREASTTGLPVVRWVTVGIQFGNVLTTSQTTLYRLPGRRSWFRHR
jgi:alpha-glucosidase (family GH31 glycosyl hydrolase)